MPICHPDLAPQILKPEDLLRHPLLYHLEQPDDWRIWLETQSGVQSFSVDSGFSTVAGIIDAVADNFGVGIVPRCLAGRGPEDAARGAPFPHPVPLTAATISACCARAATIRSWTRSQWLQRRAQQDLNDF